MPTKIASIEYGMAHVHTPLVIVLGHSQCGAVTAAAQAVQGGGLPAERNIPALIESIQPAVHQAKAKHSGVEGEHLIPFAIEQNVWLAIENLFRQSPTAREYVLHGRAKVLGALYDVGTGKVEWLSEFKVSEILNRVESDPDRATEA